MKKEDKILIGENERILYDSKSKTNNNLSQYISN